MESEDGGGNKWSEFQMDQIKDFHPPAQGEYPWSLFCEFDDKNYGL